ncbi:unnamed protein product [Ilex paraguariensis]|uniref:Uncharacterized protein n=1 Tax=Ilex paraguariensis TaxID=185542 RepID=A0ABC8RXY1_9AQUA
MLVKRDSLATGSWNIQDEIRRVRSKATEDLLRTLPSTKIDLSSYALEPKNTENASVADKAVASMEDKAHVLNALTTTKPIDASLNFASGTGPYHGSPPVLEMAQDGSRNDAVSPNAATSVTERNQDLTANPTAEGGGAAIKSRESMNLEFGTRQLAGYSCAIAPVL